jgi:uncharacterized protein YrrD
MLRNAQRLTGYHLGATDGTLGKIRDFYFDDEHWTIRYLVAGVDGWLAGKQVLLSPFAVDQIDDGFKTVHLRLSRDQIEKSPPIETEQPISRQFEAKYYQYYGWPMYWYGPALWGPGPYPVFDGFIPEPVEHKPEPPADPHLRSTGEVLKYRIHARDGDIGHVEDYMIDDETWSIRYFEVDTRNWLPGKKMLIPTSAIQNVSWENAKVFVDLTRQVIKDAPEYHPGDQLQADYEKQLQEHLARAGQLTT